MRNYMSTLRRFVLWLDVPVEEVTHKKILHYIDVLLDHRLQPKTINSHLDSIRGFYEYLHEVEDIPISNPVRRGYALRLYKPLPRYLRDEEVEKLFDVVSKPRDRAIFKLMLRCGLRVEEVADLTIGAMDLKRRRIFVVQGKGGKGRVVCISDDAIDALAQYIRVRPSSRVKKLFLVEKGPHSGKGISVRGIQKRIEYYARKARLKVSCHQLRHTMATQLLNAGADLVAIQDLLGHSRVKTTQRYCKISNLKVEKDYFKAMEEVMRRTPS
jgi:site-specific recombinase XerD